MKYQSLNFPNDQPPGITASPTLNAYKQDQDYFFEKDDNTYPIVPNSKSEHDSKSFVMKTDKSDNGFLQNIGKTMT